MRPLAVVAVGGNALTARRPGRHGRTRSRPTPSRWPSSACRPCRPAGGRSSSSTATARRSGNLAHPAGGGGRRGPGPAAAPALRDDAGPARRRPGRARSTGAAAPAAAVAVVTHVAVDPADPAFARPDQADRPVLHAERAAELARRARLAGRRGLRPRLPPRRAVAAAAAASSRSTRPHPARRRARRLAAGGGGIAVSTAADGAFAGVDAVIDKDHAAAASLAAGSARDELVPAHRRRRRAARLRHAARSGRLHLLTADEAERHLAARPVPGREHGPKVAAALRVPARRRRLARHHHLRRSPWAPPMRATAGAGTRIVPSPGVAGSRHDRRRPARPPRRLPRLAAADVGDGGDGGASTRVELGRRGRWRPPRARRPARRRLPGAPSSTASANDLVLAVRGATRTSARGRAGRGARDAHSPSASRRPPATAEQDAGEHRARRSGAAGRQRRHRLGARASTPRSRRTMRSRRPARAAVQRRRARSRRRSSSRTAAPRAGPAGDGPGAGTARARRIRPRASPTSVGARGRGRSVSSRPPAPGRRRSRRCSTAGACGCRR